MFNFRNEGKADSFYTDVKKRWPLVGNALDFEISIATTPV